MVIRGLSFEKKIGWAQKLFEISIPHNTSLEVHLPCTTFFLSKPQFRTLSTSFEFVWWLMVVSKHLLNPNPATVLVVLLLNLDKKDTDNKIHTLLFINIKH